VTIISASQGAAIRRPDAYDILKLEFDNGQIIDLCGKTISTSGTPVVVEGHSKYLGKSLHLNGSSYIYAADSPSFYFGTDPFSIRILVYPLSVSDGYCYYQNTDGNREFRVYFNAGTVVWQYYNYGYIINLNATIVSNSYQELVFFRNGSTVGVYKDRTLVASADIGSTSIIDLTGPIYMGVNGYDLSQKLHAYVDSFTISKGVAKIPRFNRRL
jgi:hypothetical protein